MVTFERAKPQDAKALALVSWRAFDNDVNYGAKQPGGPPGYKSDLWQSTMIRRAPYCKIVSDLRIIGGLIVFSRGGGHYEPGRIFLHPEFQNQGIGTQAFAFLTREFPGAKRWTLGTPAWNRRDRHFYQKLGFLQVGVEGHPARPTGIRYERRIYPNMIQGPSDPGPQRGETNESEDTEARLP